MTQLRLAKLLQLASPALPVGAYSYSQGLEAAVEARIVTHGASAQAWISDVLELSVTGMEAPLLLRLRRAWDARDFVAAFPTLDAVAKARGVLAVTGASTTPALTHAVLDEVTRGQGRVIPSSQVPQFVHEQSTSPCLVEPTEQRLGKEQARPPADGPEQGRNGPWQEQDGRSPTQAELLRQGVGLFLERGRGRPGVLEQPAKTDDAITNRREIHHRPAEPDEPQHQEHIAPGHRQIEGWHHRQGEQGRK